LAKYVVASIGDFSSDDRKIVTVKGREIGLYRIGDEYFAVYNWCPHEGAALCKGPLVSRCRSDRPGRYTLERKGEMLRCPWHGWEYDIRTGQSWCDPDSYKARTFGVRVEPGEQLAKGPYVAETVPVEIDGEYLVLDL